MRRARTVSIPLWRASRRKLTAFRTVAQRRSEARATTDELLEHVTRLHTREAVHPERGLAARTRALWSMERIGYAFARKARRLESLRDRRVSRATSPILHVGMGVCAAEFGELDPELTARIIEKLARPEDADFAYESFGAVFGVNERATQRWLIGLKPLPRAPLRELLPRFEPARQRLMAHGYGRLLYFQHATLAAAVEAAPDTAPVNTRWAFSVRRSKVSDQAGASGAKPAPVIATRRPPGANRARAERRCRAVASVVRPSTLATAENGGFIRMTLGRSPASR